MSEALAHARAERTNTLRHPILVCYDGSPGAARAVDAAGRLFPGRDAIVLYVASRARLERIRTTSVEALRAELIEEMRVAAQRDASAVAEEGVGLARRAGLEARPLVVEADDAVAKAIARVATEESAIAVVVGRQSRTRLASLLPGSVSKSVVHRCRAPVVLA